MQDFAELTDYLGFFEAEPEILTPEVGWYYGAKFVSVRNIDRIVAIIAPGEGEISFRWWHDDTLRADFNLKGVVDWNLECNSQREILFLKFQQPGIGFFSLQLKPVISFSWVTEWA
ncbi:hypothetical protein [Collimonas fungivorans]|uniref:hypothetical protein n=1 Tax=Collimonas fungivorans TaxID=158899 RepID=UPI003FA3B695